MPRVPVLGTDHDTLLHRRDPRTKLLMFVLLVVYIYAAPTWQWMLAMTAAGLVLATIAKVPPKWLLILWLLQLPNFLGLIIIPAIRELAAGDVNLGNDLAFGLRLGFAWSAALFVSISLFSTMTVDELADGLRGLHVPEAVCFLVSYAFLLLYSGLNDIFRVIDAMKIKGLQLETKNPLRLLRNIPALMVPAIFTIVRRATTMMAVLQLRGFSTTRRGRQLVLPGFGSPDIALLGIGALIVAAAVTARFNFLPGLI